MTAKMDLLAKLNALMPECAGEIAKILHDYEIMPAKVYERSNLPRRVDAFLAAKRIDGCRPRTLEGYQGRQAADSLFFRPSEIDAAALHRGAQGRRSALLQQPCALRTFERSGN